MFTSLSFRHNHTRMSHHPAMREEELKNRVVALFFGKYDCARVVGNIDFCVSPKRRDLLRIPETMILKKGPEQ